jgi:hypothetical protein
MAALGFQTLRFWNNDVLLQTEAVLEKILHVAATLKTKSSKETPHEQTSPGSLHRCRHAHAHWALAQRLFPQYPP